MNLNIKAEMIGDVMAGIYIICIIWLPYAHYLYGHLSLNLNSLFDHSKLSTQLRDIQGSSSMLCC